ncbi:Flp family type IVb pilin [Vibrio tubiashii]|uniref:Flp family type IVb pilin n=1 Tax=Vibrio tubiashii TaxID=29498 RepID=UPI00234F00A3|nr:Flp family type IVb pilin [Vibrio tubiashii]WCP67682.1 Flp family type IVb pilin [Vibrio tubiashii]
MVNHIVQFMKEEEGLTVVEYVVGAGALALALGGFFTAFGEALVSEISNLFSD